MRTLVVLMIHIVNDGCINWIKGILVVVLCMLVLLLLVIRVFRGCERVSDLVSLPLSVNQLGFMLSAY